MKIISVALILAGTLMSCGTEDDTQENPPVGAASTHLTFSIQERVQVYAVWSGWAFCDEGSFIIGGGCNCAYDVLQYSSADVINNRWVCRCGGGAGGVIVQALCAVPQ